MGLFTWEVRPDQGEWKVYREGIRVLNRPTREACVEYARREAQTESKFFDSSCRLLLTNENGSVDEEFVAAQAQSS